MVGEAPKGRTHIANAVEERTGVSNLLPTPLDRNNSLVARCLRSRKLHEGHIFVAITDEELDEADAITEFLVPGGKRMLPIGAEQVMAKGIFGKALNYAATVAAQIKIETADGRTYFAQGVYSFAPVEGEMIFEIQYWPAAGIPERCLKKPKKLTRNIMKNAKVSERRFGYVFLVDPGVNIISFSAGRATQKLNIDVPG